MVLLPADDQPASGAAGEDLLIDRFEVTDGEFGDFVAKSGYVPLDPSGFLAHWPRVDGRRVLPPERDTPVRFVSLDDAMAYARWCGKEVPTRDEWLRGCPSLRDGAFPWRGRYMAGACNALGSELEAPTPVGTYELGRSSSGCYDMIGNVREWTATEASGPETRCVLGGSFRQHCYRLGQERPGEALGHAFGPTVSASSDLEDKLSPWLDRVAPALRYDDLGFRCVIRNATSELDLAFAAIERLEGNERRTAIDELLRVGEWSFGPNQVLPFVRAHAFARRVRWRVDLADENASLARGGRVVVLASPSSASAAKDDVVVVRGGEWRVLEGTTGHELARVSLPLEAARPRAEWIRSARATWLCLEGAAGEIALVAWPRGEAVTLGAPVDGSVVTQTWLASDSASESVWFVQSLEGPASERPRTRVARFTAGSAAEVVFDGALSVPPAPAGGDGLVVIVEHDVEVTLPHATSALDHKLTIAWESAELLSARDLSIGARCFIVWEGRKTADPDAAPPLVRRFVREGTESARATEFAATDDGSRWIVPTTLPSTYLVHDGAGHWRRFGLANGALVLSAPLRPRGDATAAVRAFTLLPSLESELVDPLLLSEDGRELHRLPREGEALEPIASGLPFGGALAWSGLDRDARHLVVRTLRGDWFGLDLSDPARRFELRLPSESSINTPRMTRAGGAELLLCQTTSYGAWFRSLVDGRLVDEIGVARPPMSKVLALDVDGDGTPDPVVLFDDLSLVALGSTDRTATTLLDDFTAAAGADR